VEGPYDIETALTAMSRDISVRSHRFVSSISTTDIVTALTNRYANVSEQLNEDYRQLSEAIREAIQQHEQLVAREDGESQKLECGRTTLETIREQVRQHSQKRESILRPITGLGELIQTIFRHKGIRVTERITLGNVDEAMKSELLSAGEKQMLSFLVYNAFERNSVVFIDEPEISLHVDWQRRLFPTLLAQGSENQFIVATHSPFIYANYSDKELLLDNDRGE